MGKKNKNISLNTISHPNSRKAKQLAKHNNKVASRDKSKMVTYMKQNLLGEKLIWFQEHLDPNLKEMTPSALTELIEVYLSRFDEELEQIEMKHSVGHRKSRQHASREDILKSTKKREREEYNGPGIELVDFFNIRQLELLKSWNGELRFLPNFILKRFNKNQLESKISKQSTEASKDLNKDNIEAVKETSMETEHT